MSKHPPLPDEIAITETLARCIYSPFHIQKDGRIKPSAFRPTYDLDEISVNRLDYAGQPFCMEFGFSESKLDKVFSGLALVKMQQILQTGADCMASPLPNNPFHAHIFFGKTLNRGEVVPAFINEMMLRLAESAVFVDSR